MALQSQNGAAGRKFPNLFIIGAMKAGTSSLHEYLHQHPEIFMARFKEPQFFAPHTTRTGYRWGQGNPYPEPGADWYLRLFAGAGDVKYAGESSVSYTARPWVTGCEKRIWEFNPEARLIYILRDPIERTLSHYWYFVADGREDCDMLTAVRRKPDYVARSYYAMQLRPYLETFGRDRVYLMTLEELDADPQETFRRLFTWLGVDPDFPVAADTRFNVGPTTLRQTRRYRVPVDTFLKGWYWAKLQGFVPRSVPGLLERFTYRLVSRRDADPGPAVRYLRPLLQRYTQELTELVGREFPEWETLHATAGQSPATAV
jgi:hypothetical protein